MVDHVQGSSSSVCCMCGDVGFPDKIFRCNKCRYRLQHSYCSNYYSELAEPIEQCDWCRSEERNVVRHGGGRSVTSSKAVKNYLSGEGGSNRSEYAGGDRIKQHDHHEHNREEIGGGENSNSKGGGKSASPRTATRRYKLLKDVMC